MCFALLAGAGVLLRSFLAAQSVAPGFDIKQLVSVSLRLRLSGYNSARAATLFPALLDRLRAQPGVESVALADSIPYGGLMRRRTIQGIDVNESEVSPEYFRTIGLHLISGRDFTRHDADSPGAIIVSESLARRLWPDQSPMGRTIRTGARTAQVVGVVPDVRTLESDAHSEQIYRPLIEAGLLDAIAIIRVLPKPETMVLPLEQAVRGVAPELQVTAGAIENARDASLASVRWGDALRYSAACAHAYRQACDRWRRIRHYPFIVDTPSAGADVDRCPRCFADNPCSRCRCAADYRISCCVPAYANCRRQRPCCSATPRIVRSPLAPARHGSEIGK